MKYIEQRSSVINPLTDFKKLKESKKSLRIKLGVDPTAPDVTLGWYAVIRALKKFQEYGHTAVLILGEFTAQVGDPSGKSETRNLIEEKEIDTNSNGVLPIIKNILDKDNLEIVSNKDWLGKLDVNKIMELASSTTLAQMLEREDFAKRYSEKNSISLLEFFYPLYQGYDSVAVKADIEIGGNDQLWNLMLGREIQKYYKMEPQVAVTFPLLIGTDGKKKMSQSLNNYISITDTPENIYGKIMSIPDLITSLPNLISNAVDKNEWIAYGAIFLAMFLENIIPPIPSELIMPLGGFYIYQGQLDFIPVVLAGLLGTVLGAFPWYGIGRLVNEDRLENILRK